MKDKMPQRSNVNVMNLLQTFNIPRIYSSLEEASEFCLNLFAKDHKTFTIIDQEKHKIKQVLIHYLEPHDYGIYYVNIDLHYQYEISVAESQTFFLARHPLVAR